MLKKLLLLSLCLSVSFPSQALTEQFIVKFKPKAHAFLSSNHLLGQSLGLSVPSHKPMAGKLSLLHINQSNLFNSKAKILKKLRENALIEYAFEDRKSYINPMPALKSPINTVPSHALQWDHFSGPGGMMLETGEGKKDGAWHYSLGDAFTPVVVAVIDTGVELNERLKESFILTDKNEFFGWNFAGNNADFSDETGSYHGTHVAGTIAANGTDNYGVGPKLKILPVKIPDKTGLFYESAVINAIYWSAGGHVPGVPDNTTPAKVMNMSFGIDIGPGKEVETCSQPMQDVVDYAISKGSVLVVAAGNNNTEHDLGAPAGCNGTIRVSATGPTGLRAYYSNYGEGVSYAAPGGDKRFGPNGAILSTVNVGGGLSGSGLDYKQGTSMASPHVAGVFGLVFAYGQANNITAKEARNIIYSTTHGFGMKGNEDNACVGNKACGHGIVDAFYALDAVNQDYRFILNAPALSQLALTHEGCSSHEVRAKAEVIDTPYGQWKLLNNACVSKENLDLPRLNTMDFSVSASYGKLKYRIYPEGHCQVIGVDGVGCS